MNKINLPDKFNFFLKKRGWTFVGPTICYSFMQSMGLVNDHVDACFRKEIVADLRQKFRRP